MSDDMLDLDHVCTEECRDRRVAVVACTADDMESPGNWDFSLIAPPSPHQDCQHRERDGRESFDLQGLCRMCGRVRQECVPDEV